jgi:hypothetical protein
VQALHVGVHSQWHWVDAIMHFVDTASVEFFITS